MIYDKWILNRYKKPITRYAYDENMRIKHQGFAEVGSSVDSSVWDIFDLVYDDVLAVQVALLLIAEKVKWSDYD